MCYSLLIIYNLSPYWIKWWPQHIVKKYISVNIDYISMFDSDTLAPYPSLHIFYYQCIMWLSYMNEFWWLDGLAPGIKQSIKLMTHVHIPRLKTVKDCVELYLCHSVYLNGMIRERWDSFCVWYWVSFLKGIELLCSSNQTVHIMTPNEGFSHSCILHLILKRLEMFQMESCSHWWDAFFHTPCSFTLASSMNKIKSSGMLHCIDC